LDRPFEGRKRKKDWDRKKCPIELKESYKWIGPALEVQDTVLSKSEHILYVMDREADIMEVYERLNTERSDVLVRNSQNRRVRVDDKIDTIKNILANQPVRGKIRIKIKKNNKKRRKERLAKMEIRYVEVELQWPERMREKGTGKKVGIPVTVIEAREKEHRGYKGEPPLKWILITTEKIENIASAKEAIRNYAKRWNIEDYFKLIKTDGYNIENTELTKGRSIRKLTLIVMKMSIIISKLKSSRKGNSNLKTTEVFNKEEINLLKLLNVRLEGATQKQKNPFSEDDLAWATWVIARLGGWKEFYNKDRPPGNKTLKWGLERFNALMLGCKICLMEII